MVRTRVHRFAAAGALFIFFALALHFAALKSPTADEGVHIARGWALWQAADLRLQAQPPLSHWLNGLFLSTEPTLPDLTELASWSTADRPQIAHEFLWESGVAVDRVVFLARLPIVFLALLMGAVLGRWTAAWTGRGVAALIALFFFALSPNVLAAGGLATTDLVTTALLLTTIGALWRYLQRPGVGSWLLVGVALGLGLGTKVTAAILLPVTLMVVITHHWLPGADQGRSERRWLTPLLLWLSWLPVAALIVWSLYRFELRPLPGTSYPVPAATYIDNYLHVEGHLESGHPAFLLGEISSEGWWYYFLVAFALKTPVTVLVLLPMAAFSAGRRWRETIYLWLPAGTLFVAASVSGLNIGYRHILPALPFIWMLIAVNVPRWLPDERGGRRRLVLTFLLGWYAFGTMRQFPHFLAYFNEIAGGPEQGYKYLGDSNIDWGQDLKLLAEFISGDEAPAYSDEWPLTYSYFGASDPTYYGIERPPLHREDGRARDLAPANPARGRYAISVNHVQGMVLEERDLFDWFRRREPAGRLGYSILVYDVERADRGTWMAHCLDPAPLLEEDSAREIVGAEEGVTRDVYFDCKESWIFPNGGEPGWYLLPQRAEPWPMVERFRQQLRHVYTHAASEAAPSYDVYYWEGGRALAESLSDQPAAATLPSGAPVDLPVVVEQEQVPTADLLGYWREPLGKMERWTTMWEARTDSAQGLTVAAHLYGDQAAPVVADGLGFTAEQWEPGDVFIQYHTFAVPEAGRYLSTGLYEFSSGDRLPFSVPGQQVNELFLFPKDGSDR